MKFKSQLIKGNLVRRYKRFMADVRLMDNRIVTAHCANPGSMINLLENDADVWISYVDNPKRKLMYTLEIIRSNKTRVGVNTNIPNRLNQPIAVPIATGTPIIASAIIKKARPTPLL